MLYCLAHHQESLLRRMSAGGFLKNAWWVSEGYMWGWRARLLHRQKDLPVGVLHKWPLEEGKKVMSI